MNYIMSRFMSIFFHYEAVTLKGEKKVRWIKGEKSTFNPSFLILKFSLILVSLILDFHINKWR